MSIGYDWFHLKVHGIDVYCQFIVAGHAWCLGFRGIEGITVEVVGKTMGKLLACGVFWLFDSWDFWMFANQFFLSYLVKLWESPRTFRLIISMIWGGKIARSMVMPMTCPWLLFLKRWRRLDGVSRSSRRFRNPQNNHRFGCKKGPF